MKCLRINGWLRLAVPALAALGLTACMEESALDHADTNDDGKLSNPELEYALIEAVFYKSDVNKDGVVSFEEWQKIYPDASKKEFMSDHPRGGSAYTLEDTVKVFRDDKVFHRLIAKIDTNSNGYIGEKEAAAFWDEYHQAAGDNEVQKLGSMTGS